MKKHFTNERDALAYKASHGGLMHFESVGNYWIVQDQQEAAAAALERVNRHWYGGKTKIGDVS